MAAKLSLTQEDVTEVFNKFRRLKTYYSTRNAHLEDIQYFYSGEQWEEAADPEKEELRLVLNYTRRSVLWHTAYLTRKSPRVDVPEASAEGPDIAAKRREAYLRALAELPSFRRTHRRMESNANKYGFGIMQAIWKPGKGQPKTRDVGSAEGSEEPKRVKVYTKPPWKFRSITPENFLPRYRTYDEPNDFLYVFRYDPDRMVEDIQQQYDVELQPTSTDIGTPGGVCDLVEYWDDEDYILIAITQTQVRDGRKERTEYTPHVITAEKHDYGRPPFFVVPNIVDDANCDPTDDGCVGEVDLIRDTNKTLNLIYSLTAEEIATRIKPPAVYKTDDPRNPAQDPNKIKLGAGQVIPIGTEEDLDPMEWAGVPEIVVNFMDRTMQAMRDQSGLPRTSFGEGRIPSGVGMRLAYAALELVLALKVPEREDHFRDLFSAILEITDRHLGSAQMSFWNLQQEKASKIRLTKEDINDAYYCRVRYGNLLPRNKVEWEQHVVYLYKTNMIPLKVALEWLEDIDDPDRVIELLKKEMADPKLHPEIAAMIQQLEQQQQQPQQQPGTDQGDRMSQAQRESRQMSAQQQGQGELRGNAAPPVPVRPSRAVSRNAPFLDRGQAPNLQQVFPSVGRPGINVGPREEE